MTRDEIIDLLGEEEEVLFLDPGEKFDVAILGIARFFGSAPRVAYSYDGVIQAMVDDGMDVYDAAEFFDYNIIGAYVGESTPVFVWGPDSSNVL